MILALLSPEEKDKASAAKAAALIICCFTSKAERRVVRRAAILIIFVFKKQILRYSKSDTDTVRKQKGDSIGSETVDTKPPMFLTL